MAEADSPFVLAKVRHNVSLAPCYIGEPRLGIEQEMTSLLMSYSDRLQGVILSFSNVKLDKPHGQIVNEMPYIHCKVIADALVFQPREGMVLNGTVNKIGSNHIGMLFAGVFNGSVAASELPKGFVHNYHKDSWLGADGSSISVMDTVEVKVLRVHVAGGMIAIEASMRSRELKAVSKKSKTLDAPTSVEQQSPVKKSSKKRSADVSNPNSKKHKHKHVEEVVEAEEVPTPKEKKSKHKESKKKKKKSKTE